MYHKRVCNILRNCNLWRSFNHPALHSSNYQSIHAFMYPLILVTGPATENQWIPVWWLYNNCNTVKWKGHRSSVFHLDLFVFVHPWPLKTTTMWPLGLSWLPSWYAGEERPCLLIRPNYVLISAVKWSSSNRHHRNSAQTGDRQAGEPMIREDNGNVYRSNPSPWGWVTAESDSSEGYNLMF